MRIDTYYAALSLCVLYGPLCLRLTDLLLLPIN